jgi:DNA-binding IclR family transcriptional regulator
MVIVDRVEGNPPVKVIVPVGTHQRLNHGAPGKLLLAFHYPTDSTKLRELISRGKITKLTEQTLIDPRRLEDELNKIRRLGYATSDGEAIRRTIGLQYRYGTQWATSRPHSRSLRSNLCAI